MQKMTATFLICIIKLNNKSFLTMYTSIKNIFKKTKKIMVCSREVIPMKRFFDSEIAKHRFSADGDATILRCFQLLICHI